MSNRQPNIHHPLSYQLLEAPISGISDSRMTSLKYDRQTTGSSRTESDASQPERQPSLPVNRIAAFQNKPSSINIEALDNCFRDMDDYLQEQKEG